MPLRRPAAAGIVPPTTPVDGLSAGESSRSRISELGEYNAWQELALAIGH